MHATAKSGRGRLVFAVLLVLLGLSHTVAPGTDSGYPARHRTSVVVESAPSVHHDPHDWLRLSGVVRHTSATALPDNWWAVYTRTVGERAPRGRSARAVTSSGEAATATPASRSSRAPPAV